MIVEYIRYKLDEAATQPAANGLNLFEAAYLEAAASLDTSAHCRGYELSRCVEEKDRYILRIEWDSLEGHMQGFRRAPEFAPFFAAIKPYIARIEEMQHYAVSSIAATKRA
ncbi:MAG TPA: antibiotic biosynthesis monooxygenase [Povalibacter sp.]|nr:antibiotic biosynthesis monooxygenase [Povalibacter sp.]